MSKFCTDIKQSKKLIDMGFPKDSADMFWDLLDGDADEDKIPFCMPDRFAIEDNEFIPAWSIDALMGLMPKFSLEKDISNDTKYQLHYNYNTIYYDDPVDAAFEMVVWLKESGKI